LFPSHDLEGAFEQFGDDIVGLASALLVGKDPTKVKNVVTALGKAVATKGASKGVEKLGGGKTAQLVTEMGTLFLLGLFSKDAAKKMVSDKYDRARSFIPKNAVIKTEGLSKELAALEKDLSKGLSTTTKNDVKAAVQELQQKISSGKYPADELVQSFHDINERMSQKNLFQELSKTEQRNLRHRYNQFKDKVSTELAKYGKENPEFYKEWSEANEAFKTFEESKKVTRYLEGHIGKLPPKLATSMAIEVFLGHPEAAAATGASFAGLKTGELLYRIGKSPTLQKHYLDVIQHASAENFPAMVNSLNRLDKGLKESFASED
jgi:hypothetical protein